MAAPSWSGHAHVHELLSFHRRLIPVRVWRSRCPTGAFPLINPHHGLLYLLAITRLGAVSWLLHGLMAAVNPLTASRSLAHPQVKTI